MAGETRRIGIRSEGRDRSTSSRRLVTETSNDLRSDPLKFVQGCVTTTLVTLEPNPKYIKMKLKDLTVKMFAAVAVLGFAFATVSCEKAADAPAVDAAKDAAKEAGDAAKDAAGKAGAAVEKAGEAVKDAAAGAADAAKGAVNDAAKKVEEATK